MAGLSVLPGNPVSEDPNSSIFLRLGPSRQLGFLLGALHVGAAACGFMADLPLAARSLLAGCLLVAALRAMALHGSRRAARAIVLLVWDRYGQWRLVRRDGRTLQVELEHGAYAHPKLLVLLFRGRDRQRVPLLVVPDMVNADELRRLRMRLRCGPWSNP